MHLQQSSVRIARRRARDLALAALFASTAMFVAVGPAHAAASPAVPFTDPNAVGLVGFCDQNNKPVTSGSIRDVPFAIKAVSNTAAPAPYNVKGSKATLYAYSPMKDIDPGQWTPYQMTMSAAFTNSKHPMTDATYRDAPLEYPVTGIPPKWDGLVQLRVILSTPNNPPLLQPYPTAVIKVQGDTWTMVSGDRNPACTAGSAKSLSRNYPASLPKTPPKWAANYNAVVHPSTSASGTPTPQDSATQSPVAVAAAGDDNALAAAPSTSAASVWGIAGGLLLATVAVAAVVAIVAARRQRTSPQPVGRREIQN